VIDTAAQVRTSAPSSSATLRKLFLTLFLRGHTSQGLKLQTAPTSIAQKLGLALFIYAFMGLFTAFLWGNDTFFIAASLHGLTFLMIGMFLIMSAGESLFNKEESEILLHRPVEPRTLLWAKVFVLVQVSTYLALALNLVGFVVGFSAEDGNGLFPLAHLLSTGAEALFSAGCIILVYQLCLKWFGRRRLENAMTLMQVLCMVAFFVGSQLLPRLMVNSVIGGSRSSGRSWWLEAIPPGWFAGFDDAVAGSHAASSWLLALIGFAATAAVCWLAFVKLAKTYESGVQALNEASVVDDNQSRQFAFLAWIATKSPARWWLHDSVERTSFKLTAAYLMRDRETKLRVYPSIAPAMIMPLVMGLNNTAFRRTTPPIPRTSYPGSAHMHAVTDSLTALTTLMPYAFAGAFAGFVAASALNMLSYSQQWRASEAFYAAPIPGPWPFQRGAMVAVSVFLMTPLIGVLVVLAVVMQQLSAVPLLLPGLLLIPVYSYVPALLEGAVPLSRASEEAKNATRGCLTGLSIIPAFVVSGGAIAASLAGFLLPALLAEAALVALFVFAARRHLQRAGWRVRD